MNSLQRVLCAHIRYSRNMHLLLNQFNYWQIEFILGICSSNVNIKHVVKQNWTVQRTYTKKWWSAGCLKTAVNGCWVYKMAKEGQPAAASCQIGLESTLLHCNYSLPLMSTYFLLLYSKTIKLPNFGKHNWGEKIVKWKLGVGFNNSHCF